jgi:hypothetical protein
MREEKFFDRLTKGIADAVADIREKVVEEPMWGRALSERESATPQWPQAREEPPEPSFGGLMRNIDVGPTHHKMQEKANYRLAATEQERDRNADRDIDR